MAVKVLGAFKRDQNDRQEQRRAKPTHTAAHYKKRKKKKLPLNFKTTHENFYLIAYYFSGKETKTKTEKSPADWSAKEMGVIANAVELFLR